MKKEKVNPWIAAGLNLVILGAGLVYLGKWFNAIIYWAIVLVFILSGYGWQGTALLLIVCCAHSYYLAEKQNEAKK